MNAKKLQPPPEWRVSVEDWVKSLIASGCSEDTVRCRRYKLTHAATHDLYLVARLLGHASVETTQIYVAMPDARLRAGMAAVMLGA